MIDDNPKVRKAFGYQLYSHVAYQDGDGTNAPALIYADADYECGDGKCGLHSSGKSANEPAIVYVRADGYIRALDEIERLNGIINRAGALASQKASLEHIGETLSRLFDK
jgi:hypothetical protein